MNSSFLNSQNLQMGYGFAQALRARKLRKDLESQGGLEGMMADSLDALGVGTEEEKRLAQEQFDFAQRAFSGGIPEASKQFQQDLIQQSQQDTLSNLSSLGAGVRGLSAVQGNALSAYRDLAARDAEQRLSNQQSLVGARNLYTGSLQDIQQRQTAGVRDFIEKPFYAKAQQMQADEAAGMQNIMGGLQGKEAKREQAMGVITKALTGGMLDLGAGDDASGYTPTQGNSLMATSGVMNSPLFTNQAPTRFSR